MPILAAKVCNAEIHRGSLIESAIFPLLPNSRMEHPAL